MTVPLGGDHLDGVVRGHGPSFRAAAGGRRNVPRRDPLERATTSGSRAPAARLRWTTATPLTTRRAPVIAGRYSLEREIGRGGSGVVWLGRDEVLGRQVALKRIGLLPGADRTDLARAEREARLSAQLNHPHVVAIFDVVVDGDTDARWLVMEYVDGPDPRRAGPRARAACPRRGRSAALAGRRRARRRPRGRHRPPRREAVQHPGRRRRQVKLTDFGIAQIASDPSLTQTGMVTGSPAYLAPEVATGGRGGEAADVWSLGATAFTCWPGARRTTSATTCSAGSTGSSTRSRRASATPAGWRRCSRRRWSATRRSAGRWRRCATSWPTARAAGAAGRRGPPTPPTTPARWR